MQFMKRACDEQASAPLATVAVDEHPLACLESGEWNSTRLSLNSSPPGQRGTGGQRSCHGTPCSARRSARTHPCAACAARPRTWTARRACAGRGGAAAAAPRAAASAGAPRLLRQAASGHRQRRAGASVISSNSNAFVRSDSRSDLSVLRCRAHIARLLDPVAQESESICWSSPSLWFLSWSFSGKPRLYGIRKRRSTAVSSHSRSIYMSSKKKKITKAKSLTRKAAT